MLPIYWRFFYRSDQEIRQISEELFARLFDIRKQLREYEDFFVDVDVLMVVPLRQAEGINDAEIQKAFMQSTNISRIRTQVEQVVSHLKQLQSFAESNELILKQLIIYSPEDVKSDVLGLLGSVEGIIAQIIRYRLRAEQLLERVEEKEREAAQIFEMVIEKSLKDKVEDKQVDITGTWDLNYGRFFFQQDGDNVKGYYRDKLASVQAKIDKGVIKGVWENPTVIIEEKMNGRWEGVFGDEYGIGTWGFQFDPLQKKYYWYGVKRSDEIPSYILFP